MIVVTAFITVAVKRALAVGERGWELTRNGIRVYGPIGTIDRIWMAATAERNKTMKMDAVMRMTVQGLVHSGMQSGRLVAVGGRVVEQLIMIDVVDAEGNEFYFAGYQGKTKKRGTQSTRKSI